MMKGSIHMRRALSLWPVLASLFLCNGAGALAQLHFAYVTSFGGGFDSSGTVPAVELALRQVALNDSVLPGYNLSYSVWDSGVGCMRR